MERLTKSKRYVSFVKDRNRALEEILQKTLIRLSSNLDRLLSSSQEIAVYVQGHVYGSHVKESIHNRLEATFSLAALSAIEIIHNFRQMTYLLTYAGEAEALGRATGQTTSVALGNDELNYVNMIDAPSGGRMNGRIKLAYSRLQRRVQDTIERGILIEWDRDEMEDAIISVFPKKRRYKRPLPAAKAPSLREAKLPTQKDFDKRVVTGFIDQGIWDKIVQEYLAEYIPGGRGPEDVIQIDFGKTTYEIYEWELEKELTEDFVSLVRKGQVDAANKNGINEFQWVAIIDDKTDECCRIRDGLTTSEIEEKLSGQWKNHDCKAKVPPAHFNCRCDLAPMTEGMPEEEPKELGDFDTWLK